MIEDASSESDNAFWDRVLAWPDAEQIRMLEATLTIIRRTPATPQNLLHPHLPEVVSLHCTVGILEYERCSVSVCVHIGVCLAHMGCVPVGVHIRCRNWNNKAGGASRCKRTPPNMNKGPYAAEEDFEYLYFYDLSVQDEADEMFNQDTCAEPGIQPGNNKI